MNGGKSMIGNKLLSTGICYYSVVPDCKCNSYPCDCESVTTTPPPITETFIPTTAPTTPSSTAPSSMYMYNYTIRKNISPGINFFGVISAVNFILQPPTIPPPTDF